MVAHLIARQLDISPWEALLLAVKRAAGWSYFYETKLAELADGNDDELRPGGSHHDWVVALERVTDKLARYSKMAVDAGVAAMLVQQARNEGEQIAQVLNAALGAVELTDEQETKMRQAMRNALMSLDAQTRGLARELEGVEEGEDDATTAQAS